MNMEVGPVQILVVGFEGNRFEGEVLDELGRLAERDVVRLLDLVLLSKDPAGNVGIVEESRASGVAASPPGTLLKALLDESSSNGTDADDSWNVVDSIPNCCTAAVALLEHRWAIPLRDAMVRMGGVGFADAWVHADDLA